MPILARQQSFIQLCWKYKHDHNNKGRIMDTIKKRERRGGKQVVRVKLTKEDKRWQPWNVEDLMISIVVCGFYLDRETNTNTATTCSLLLWRHWVRISKRYAWFDFMYVTKEISVQRPTYRSHTNTAVLLWCWTAQAGSEAQAVSGILFTQNS